MILEGWRDAIYAGQYSRVLYDCANDSVARWISRLAKKARLTRSELNVVVQARSEEIATLAPAADDDVPPDSNADAEPPPAHEVQVEPARVPEASAPVETAPPAARPEPRPETPEEAAGAPASLSRDLRDPRGQATTEMATLTRVAAPRDVRKPRWRRKTRRPRGVELHPCPNGAADVAKSSCLDDRIARRIQSSAPQGPADAGVALQ